MAFGSLIDSTFQNYEDTAIRVLLERDGYSGTTYGSDSAGIQSEDTKHGNAGDDLSRRRASLMATVKVVADKAAVIQELRKIPQQGPRQHRLTIERGGDVKFKGWAKPDATSTSRIDGRTDVVTLQGKDNLRGLGADWYDSNGDAFQGHLTYANVISTILSQLSLSLPIHAVMNWRPSTMAGSDDPLSIQAPAGAFYRSDSGDNQRAATRGEVLDSLLRSMGAEVVQEDGVWKIQQKGAFASGSSVDVWEYDSSGTFQQQTTRSTTVDVTNEDWEKGSGEVQGEREAREARIIYEHGASARLPLNGGFEERDGDEPDGWFFYENGVARSFSDGPLFGDAFEDKIIEGDFGLKIEGQKSDPGTADQGLYQFANDWAEKKTTGDATAARRKQWVSGAEDLLVRIQARFEVVDNGGSADLAKIYWGLRGEATESGTTYYYASPNADDVFQSTGWLAEADIAVRERKNTIDLGDPSADMEIDPVDREFVIPAPPEAIDPYLEIYQTVSRPVDSQSEQYTIWVNYDALELRRNAGSEQPSTTYRVYDAGAEEGDRLEESVRLGDGPWSDTLGPIWDDNGDNTDGWTVLGESGEYAHTRLIARETARLRASSREVTRFTLARPSNIPRMDRAIVYDGTRYWPLMIKERQPSHHFEVHMVELDRGTVPSSFELLPGDGETIARETADPSTAGTTTSPSTSSTDPDSGAGVESMQGRTGDVEFASEDAGTGLEINTSADPNQIQIGQNGVGTRELDRSQNYIFSGRLQVEKTGTDWFVAKITDDSNSVFTHVRDSGNNDVGRFEARGLDGAGAGRYEVRVFDDIRLLPDTRIGDAQAPQETLHVAGTSQFDGDMTLGMANTDYLLQQGRTGNLIAIENQSSGDSALVDIFTKDKDGTNNVEVSLYGESNSASNVTDRSRLSLKWAGFDNRIEVKAESSGTGSDLPLHLFASGNTDQIVARTDGDVAMNNSLKIGGTGSPTDTLHVAGTSQFDGDMTLGMGRDDVTIKSGFATDDVVLASQVSDSNVGLSLVPQDKDGTDQVRYQLWAFGDPNATDYERGIFEYLSAPSRYEIFSDAGGTGSHYPFHIYSGGNTDQIVAATNGNVGIGTGSPSHAVDVDGVARAQTRFRSPETRTDGTLSSGWTGSGWIAADSHAGKSDTLEVSNAIIRETLRVFELEVRDITFTRGPLGVTPGGGKLEDVASSTHTAVTNTYEKWDITAVDTTNDTVDVDNTTVSADPATDLNDGQDICITGSTGNDDNYTVSSTTDNGDGTTTIAVNESIGDSTADGQVQEAKQQQWTFENKSDDATKPGLSQGDRLLAQRFDSSTQNVVVQVRAVVDETSSQDGTLSAYQFNVTVDSERMIPANGADTEGYEFIVNASSNTGRDSFLYFDPYAPAGSAFDGVSDFDDWDARADLIRFRWGNLDTYYDYTSETYGIAAGDPNGTWIGADDGNGVRIFTGGSTKMIEFTTAGTGFIRDILQVGTGAFIGNNVSTKDAASTALLGLHNDGSLPIAKVRGPDTSGGPNYVQMVGRTASTDAIFRVNVDGAKMLDIVPDTGLSMYDGNGTLQIEFDVTGGAFIRDVLRVGSGVFVGNNLASRFAGPETALLGLYNDGSLPIVRVQGADTSGGPNYVQMVGRSTTSDAFFRADVNGTTMLQISGDRGIEIADSGGTRTIHFDTAGDVFIANEIQLGTNGQISMGNASYRWDKGFVGHADVQGDAASGMRWYNGGNPTNAIQGAITPRLDGGTFEWLHLYSKQQLALEGEQHVGVDGALFSLPTRTDDPSLSELQNLQRYKVYQYVKVISGTDTSTWEVWIAWINKDSGGTVSAQYRQIYGGDGSFDLSSSSLQQDDTTDGADGTIS